MREWVGVAQVLRSVKSSAEDFAMRGWVHQQLIGPLLLDRIAEDLQQNGPTPIELLQRRARPADES
jgi:hypothetical protein